MPISKQSSSQDLVYSEFEGLGFSISIHMFHRPTFQTVFFFSILFTHHS